jgi:hypothetical protein
MTKEQILKKLQERKQERANQALLEQGQPEVKKAVAKRPVLSRVVEESADRVNHRVIRESYLERKQEPRTIEESISERTSKFDKKQQFMYKTLAENIANAARVMAEATQAGTGVYGVQGNGAGVGLVKTYFDIFFGYFPNLITPMIASTQPIKTEKAMIFFYETLAGTEKGLVTAGTKLITPFTVNTDVNYTSSLVNLPAISSTGAYDSTAKVLWGPVVARSIVITGASAATLVWSTDTAFTGTVVDSAGTTINISAGVVTVTGTSTIQVTMTLDAAPATALVITYSYDNKYAPTQVPELNANIDSREVTALARTVKTNYSFQAGFGFEAQFGVKLEDKLAESAMYELKRETDLDFVFEVMNAAPTTVVWNKAAGVANGLYEFHKLSFRDAIIAASNHIFSVSKRVRGNVLLVGINAQTIIETLPEFKGEASGSQIGGAAKIGKLKDIDVIAIPELGANDWAVVYKNSQDNLDAGIVFAPYIPVVATSPVTLDDLVIRRAYTCSYGKLVVNANYFVKGTIINNPVALPVFLVGATGATYGILDTDAVLA